MQKKFNFNNIDAISMVLVFFIVFIGLLFIYIVQINKHIENFSTYNNTVHELKNINKDFNNLLLQKGNFVNYDHINQRISKFDQKIDFLNSNISLLKFSSEYESLLQDIIKLYTVKLDTIEHFKSENAQFLYSIHYLYSLNDAISESTTLNKKSIDISNETLLDLVKYFMHIDIDIKKIGTNLEYLNNVNNHNDKLLDVYVQHAKINIERINQFKKIDHFKNSQNIDTLLHELQGFLNTNFQKNIFIGKIIIVILFFVALIILIILLIMNKRAIRMKDELLGFRTAIENSYNSIIITDINKNIVYVNERAEIESGYTKEELIGNNPRLLKSGMNDENFYTGLHTALNAGKKWEGEFINKKKDGAILYERASIMPIYQNNEVVNYVAIKLNITDYVDEKHKVEYMAYHDALTGLPNRLSVEQYLKKRLPLAKRNNSKIAILFIDLDRFKTINDTLGHSVGDELLIECSKRIKEVLRDSDILARVGGDEFIVVVEPLDNTYMAAHVSEKIIQLFKKPIQTTSHLLNVTLSIGIAMYPDDSSELDCLQLFKYADIAMYEAKDQGRNRYQYYQKELSNDAHTRLNLEQNLKDSLKNDELYLMYQPQYNLENRKVSGIEALVRWKNKKLGEINPDIFIPVAEDTGFIVDIGLFIFEQACKDFLEFKMYSETLQDISINISTVQLYQESFIDDLIKITKVVGIDTKYIKLEITETHIMKNILQSTKLLKDLKDFGFNISIDDFGTGHSSLQYLQEFPITELKIDKTFIDNLPYNTNNIAITKSILTLSQSMGYINVAEGIENAEQEQFLKENHCLTGQGYFFSKPLTKTNLINFFESN